MTKLSSILKTKKITQAELARRSKQGFRSVNYACRAGVKTVRLARIYARALNCDPLEIIEL